LSFEIYSNLAFLTSGEKREGGGKYNWGDKAEGAAAAPAAEATETTE